MLIPVVAEAAQFEEGEVGILPLHVDPASDTGGNYYEWSFNPGVSFQSILGYN